jgi:ABC-type bacteriocin/lantibiotic exporter with double-glycine peptidase domain
VPRTGIEPSIGLKPRFYYVSTYRTFKVKKYFARLHLHINHSHKNQNTMARNLVTLVLTALVLAAAFFVLPFIIINLAITILAVGIVLRIFAWRATRKVAKKMKEEYTFSNNSDAFNYVYSNSEFRKKSAQPRVIIIN